MATGDIEETEKFHLLFLAQLGSCVDKNLYALKGGCNLRFFWKSIRYSQDIDFDVHTIARETLRKNVNQILGSLGFRRILRSSKIELGQISEPKQTDSTQAGRSISESTAPPMILDQNRIFQAEVRQGSQFQPVDPEIARIHDLRPILASHYGLEAAFPKRSMRRRPGADPRARCFRSCAARRARWRSA